MKITRLYRMDSGVLKYWSRADLVRATAVLAALLLIGWLTIMHRVNAEADTTPPKIVSAQLTGPTTFDTVNAGYPGYNQTSLDMQTSDNLSGTATYPQILYTSPSGKQTVLVGTNPYAAEQWNGYIQLPQYAEAGVWTAAVYMQDNSGNKASYTSTLLHTLGVNLDITVTGQGDTTDPTLTSLTRTGPSTLDITGSSPSTTFSIRMADNVSGLRVPTLTYYSPSGIQSNAGTVCDAATDPTLNDVTYTCTAFFPHNGETGTWTPDLVIADGAGNMSHLTSAQLQARGINLNMTITGQGDTQAPVLSSPALTVSNPPSDSIPYGGAIISVSGRVTDNLSGVDGQSSVTYTSSIGTKVTTPLNFNADGSFTADVFLPSYAAGGAWTPSIYLRDAVGNNHTYNTADIVALGADLTIVVGKNITASVNPGATVTSDYENNGATPDNPVEASVTTPSGGQVSIVIVQANGLGGLNGYSFFDRQVSITAPTEAAANPLTLTFRIDASKVPLGQNATTLVVTRNGTIIPACTDQTQAVPDPCVFSRLNMSDGDVQVKIHSTTASAWASGFPSQKYDFRGFVAYPRSYPTMNNVQAGQVLPIVMQIRNVKKGVSNILDVSSTVSQQIDCRSLALTGSAEIAQSGDNSGLIRLGNSNIFDYNWRTKSNWRNSCRQLTVQLSDGGSQKAIFKFQ